MYRAYDLYRSHHAACLHIQCRTLSQKNFHRKPLEDQSIWQQYRNSNPLSGPNKPEHKPYIRSVLLKDFVPIEKQLLRQRHVSKRFTHVECLQDLSIVLRERLFEIAGRRNRRLAWSFERICHLIAESKPIRAKTFQTFSYAYELPEFSRIFRQFSRHKLPIPPILMFHGLKAAACGNSPAAMRHYLSLLRLQTGSVGFDLSAAQWNMIVTCILVTTRSPPNRSEKTLVQKKAWAQVITHREDHVTIMHGGKNKKIIRYFSVYEFLGKFGYFGISSYFRLVSRFCESQDIFKEGMAHLRGHCRRAPKRNKISNFNFNCRIQTLLSKKCPEQAWELVQNAGSMLGALQDKTWELLLQHPEYLTEWKPEMEKPVMDALERYMSKAERRLGVKWTGGADGFHVARREERDSQ